VSEGHRRGPDVVDLDARKKTGVDAQKSLEHAVGGFGKLADVT
jgi:hypothetical protein